MEQACQYTITYPRKRLARGLLRGMSRLFLLALFKIQRTGKVNFPKLWRSNRVVFGNGCKKTARWRLDADRDPLQGGCVCPHNPGIRLWFARLSGCPAIFDGFYRFFVWEAILALILLTVDRWFRNPFSWHQLLSWSLLAVSVFLLIHGANLLKHVGMPDSLVSSNPTLMWWEKTHHPGDRGDLPLHPPPHVQFPAVRGLGPTLQSPLLDWRFACPGCNPVPWWQPRGAKKQRT